LQQSGDFFATPFRKLRFGVPVNKEHIARIHVEHQLQPLSLCSPARNATEIHPLFHFPFWLPTRKRGL